jgi:hypothetical protein
MNKKNKPILSFEAVYPELEPDMIRPASSFVPKWYKDIPQHMSKYPPKDASTGTLSIKGCMPFIGALTCGYMISLPFDLVVSVIEDGTPSVTWRFGGSELIDTRPKPSIEAPIGFHPTEFVIRLPLSFKVQKGYSVLYTQPLNRFDLNFISVSGVIDGGFATTIHGNFPFFIKNGFEGVIPAGTPIAQLIPFKQQKWSSKKQKGLLEEADKNFNRSMSVLSGWYKKTFWIKKEYS